MLMLLPDVQGLNAFRELRVTDCRKFVLSSSPLGEDFKIK
jgi:hypothetical protein